jgi:hypothetical protein
MELAPIVLFTYNRPEHTEKTLESLNRNFLSYESQLIVFSDGPKNPEDQNEIKNISTLRDLVKSKNWCKSVQLICAKENKGAKKSILDGVNEVLEKHKKIIIIQDDLILGNNFLLFMNTALNLYEDEKKIRNISGYSYPINKGSLKEIFFMNNCSSWGWATWTDRWKTQTENSGEQNAFKTLINDSSYDSLFVNEGLTLYPKYSLVKNIGFKGEGKYNYEVGFDPNTVISFPSVAIEESKIARKNTLHFFKSLYSKGESSLLRRIFENLFS